MKSVALAIVCLAVTAGVVYTQNPSRLPQPAVPPSSELIPAPTPGQHVPVTPAAQRGELTIDQTLDEIERIRAQKESLDKLEQELTKQLQRKLEKQSERVNRLGLDGRIQPPPAINTN